MIDKRNISQRTGDTGHVEGHIQRRTVVGRAATCPIGTGTRASTGKCLREEATRKQEQPDDKRKARKLEAHGPGLQRLTDDDLDKPRSLSAQLDCWRRSPDW